MTEEKKNGPRIAYLNALRVAGMLAVMMIHLAATGYKQAQIESYEWVVCLIYNSITRFAVPVFVMISGAVYLNPARTVTMGGMLRKAGKLMAVFFAWAAVYALAESLEEHALFSAGYFLSVAQKTITGHYHMWYLYMLAGLCLATPFLRPIAADRQLLRLFLLLTFLLNHCSQLLSALPILGETAQAVVSKMDLGVFSGYAGYYCLGYYLHQGDFSPKTIKALGLAAPVLLGGAVIGGVALGMPNGIYQEKMPHIFVYAAAVFLLFKSRSDRFEKPGLIQAIIERLAPCSLGMYLVHPMVNFILRKLGLYALTFNPLFCIPLCSLLVCAVSYAAVSLMKRVPLIRRFL